MCTSCLVAMPISSPYALFRAADHAWPPPLRAVGSVPLPPQAASASPLVDRSVTARYNERNDSQSP